MKHCDNCNNLCLSTEFISQMYDKIIDACSDATRLHVPSPEQPMTEQLAWCVQHHVYSRSTILLFYHGSRHSLDI